jgi:transformation/transcription domain-associated protein
MLLVQYRQECPMLVKCLLVHCQTHRDDVQTLFQLLRVYTARHISSFHFLTTYLENEVAKEYGIAEKRAIFFHFVEVFNSTSYPQDLKAKVTTIAM